MNNIQEVVDLLTLEKVDDCKYKGDNLKTPWKRVFGGQVLGQALHAAYQTVPEDRFAHSMHGYFILAGNIDVPIIYEVDEIRNGRSFTTRRVVAKQNDMAIFNMSASFQTKQEGFDHQIEVPNVLPPEVLQSDISLVEKLKDTEPKFYQQWIRSKSNAMEFRPVENIFKSIHEPSRPYRHTWFKSVQDLEASQQMHHQIMAFASDYNLLTTAFLPHRGETNGENLFFASLDHALWFHRDFKVTDWLLASVDSPSASNARGFARGSVFNKDGVLVASVAQEGLIRVMKK